MTAPAHDRSLLLWAELVAEEYVAAMWNGMPAHDLVPEDLVEVAS